MQYPEIQYSIEYINKNIFEPLSLESLAKYAAYSPYHFARIFKEQTGLSPMYYLSSLRLQKAKELLLRTDLSIRDIALEIGQQSLGTFTSRFSRSIGVSPAEFRNNIFVANQRLNALSSVQNWSGPEPVLQTGSIVEGCIETSVPFEGVFLVGLFSKPIPEGLPIHGTLVSSSNSRFRFYNVRPGRYYIMATSVSWGMRAMDFMVPLSTLRSRLKEPVYVLPGAVVPFQTVMLYPPSLGDPPILISLPLLMKNFFNRITKKSN